MDEATDFDDKRSLSHPRSQVYAIFRDAKTARRAAKVLNQIGIEPAGIGFLVGSEDAAKLDAATREHGLLAKVERMGLAMGDTDTDYLACLHLNRLRDLNYRHHCPFLQHSRQTAHVLRRKMKYHDKSQSTVLWHIGEKRL
jgi:hypothetical protein